MKDQKKVFNKVTGEDAFEGDFDEDDYDEDFFEDDYDEDLSAASLCATFIGTLIGSIIGGAAGVIIARFGIRLICQIIAVIG